MKRLLLAFTLLHSVLPAQETAPQPPVASPPAVPAPAPPEAAPVPAAPAPVYGPPSIYILCGSPGDEAHHTLFEKRLKSLRQTFQRMGLPGADIHVFYGPESAGYNGTASRENFQAVCKAIGELSKAGRPVWLIVMGHANDAPGDVRFNVPGGDLSGKELASWLGDAGRVRARGL